MGFQGDYRRIPHSRLSYSFETTRNLFVLSVTNLSTMAFVCGSRSISSEHFMQAVMCKNMPSGSKVSLTYRSYPELVVNI